MMIRVVETNTCKKIKTLNNDPTLAEEVLQGCKFILARNPEFGNRIQGTNFYFFRTPSFPPRVPSYRILYRYDPQGKPDLVELIAIEEIPLKKSNAF